MGILGDILATSLVKTVVNAQADIANTAINAAGTVLNTCAENTDIDISVNAFPKPRLKVPQSSEYYINRNYQGVVKELNAYGFNSIGLLEKEDLITGWLTKDGAIAEIEINGKKQFKKNQKFPAGSHVVITYHTFKKK